MYKCNCCSGLSIAWCTSGFDDLARLYPFIIRQVADDGTGTFKVVCDSQICECGDTVLSALDFLFKFIWVFQLEYPPLLKQVFDFLQLKVYRISCGAQKASPTVNEVGRFLGFH